MTDEIDPGDILVSWQDVAERWKSAYDDADDKLKRIRRLCDEAVLNLFRYPHDHGLSPAAVGEIEEILAGTHEQRPQEQGHLFKFTVQSTGRHQDSAGNYVDSDWEGPPWTLEVRAWSLAEALRIAADRGLNAWDMHDEEEDQ